MTPPRTAIILAAGPATGVYSLFGGSSAAMLPINGRPTIHWSIRYLRAHGIEHVVIGLRAEDAKLKRFISNILVKDLRVSIVEIDVDLGPGFTLLRCLNVIERGAPCLVVLGDTLFSFGALRAEAFSKSFVLISAVRDSSRWCLVQEHKGVIVALEDKPEQFPDGDWAALIGVYYFANSARAVDSLTAEYESQNRNIQLRHALEPYISAGDLHAVAPAEWHDCGNLDSIANTRRHLIQAREFNRVKIDGLRGTIEKRSVHTAKFIDEINYYRLLPDDVAVFFPRLVNYSVDPENAHMTLDYLGYPTLSEIWVFEDLHRSRWKAIFESLAAIINCFGAYPTTLREGDVFEFYWGKTVARLSLLENNSQLGEMLARDTVRINGRQYRGWYAMKEDLRNRVLLLAAGSRGQLIHGDLCFPNILYDPTSHLLKLIDPRGRFLSAGILGDARYDIAKIMHSISGGYDFLIHDMFSVRAYGSEVDLDVYASANAETVAGIFRDTFGSNYDLQDVRVIEGLLFLSMCPLHADSPERQLAMYSIGIRILNEELYENSN